MTDWSSLPAEIWEQISLLAGHQAWGRMHAVCWWMNDVLNDRTSYTRMLFYFARVIERPLTPRPRAISRCLVLANGWMHGREVKYTLIKWGAIVPPVPYFEQDWQFGKRDGQRIVYDLVHYNIKEISEWKGGKKHGLFLQFSYTGILMRVINFESGCRHGMEAIMSPTDGTPIRISFFNHGRLCGREYSWRRSLEPGFCRYVEHTTDEGEWPNGRGICAEPTELLEHVYTFAARGADSFRRSVQLPACDGRQLGSAWAADTGELA